MDFCSRGQEQFGLETYIFVGGGCSEGHSGPISGLIGLSGESAGPKIFKIEEMQAFYFVYFAILKYFLLPYSSVVGKL